MYLTSRLLFRLARGLPAQQAQVDDACLDVQESGPDDDGQDAEDDDERDDDADVVLHLWGVCMVGECMVGEWWG